MSQVARAYDNRSQDEWQRLRRHRTEYAVTLRAFQEYFPPAPAKILDIGGGPGRYSIALTAMGYSTTLLDISKGNLEMAQINAQDRGVQLAAIVHGDATKLPSLPEPAYDVVMLMGPLYHLLDLESRQKSLEEAWRVLKPGGLIFATFITRFAPIRHLVTNDPGYCLSEPDRFNQMVDTGVHPALPHSSSPDMYFAHPDEIIPLMENAAFETLNLIGCEGIVAGHEEAVNELTGELWLEWVELNYKLGQEPTLYGAADHLLYAGRKTEDESA